MIQVVTFQLEGSEGEVTIPVSAICGIRGEGGGNVFTRIYTAGEDWRVAVPLTEVKKRLGFVEKAKPKPRNRRKEPKITIKLGMKSCSSCKYSQVNVMLEPCFSCGVEGVNSNWKVK